MTQTGSVLCNLRLGDPIGGESSLPRCHLGLLSIAAYAKTKGINVDVVDADVEPLHDREVFRRLVHLRPSLVGFATTQATVRRAVTLAVEVKKVRPSTIIIFGGEQATFTAERLLGECQALDAVLSGEGELSFVQLVKQLSSMKVDFNLIPGAIYRAGGNTKHNLSTCVSDLDSLPWIGPLQAVEGRPVALITSRGCRGACSFCSTPRFNRACRRPAWRGRSPESVLDEIAAVASLSPKASVDIHIHDADFLGMTDEGIDRARRIAELLVARGLRARIRFACQAITATRAGLDFWRLWLRAGLIKVFIGYESGTDEDLAFYRKPSRLADNMAARDVLRAAGVPSQVGFIMYNPFSTPERIASNLLFLRAIGQDHVFKHVAATLEVYPGTAVRDWLDASGLLQTDSRKGRFAPRYRSQRISRIVRALEPYRIRLYAQDRALLDLDFAAGGGDQGLLLSGEHMRINEAVLRLHNTHKRKRARVIQATFDELLKAADSEIEGLVEQLAARLDCSYNAFGAAVAKAAGTLHKEPAHV